MEPEMQKFAAVAIVGLMAFFPVFNQVKDTALEALTDADHQAKWSSFFKDWDDIPADEKLEYWDGRNRPEGDGEFDRDRVDDDAKFNNPPPQPREGDRDGDGIPDDQDADPDDPDNTERREYEWVEEVLWTFPGNRSLSRGGSSPSTEISTGASYDFVNVTYAYSGFTGSFRFEMTIDGSIAWSIEEGSQGVTVLPAEDSGSTSEREVGTAEVAVKYDYTPLSAPQSFDITITGAYKDYSDESGDDD